MLNIKSKIRHTPYSSPSSPSFSAAPSVLLACTTIKLTFETPVFLISAAIAPPNNPRLDIGAWGEQEDRVVSLSCPRRLKAMNKDKSSLTLHLPPLQGSNP